MPIGGTNRAITDAVGIVWQTRSIAEAEATVSIFTMLFAAALSAVKVLQLPAHHQTDWDAFQLIRLTLHEQADHLITVPHLLVDTVRPPQECLISIMRWLEQIFLPHRQQA